MRIFRYALTKRECAQGDSGSGCLWLASLYEAPTVENGKNGYEVWSDEEFIELAAMESSNHESLALYKVGEWQLSHFRYSVE